MRYLYYLCLLIILSSGSVNAYEAQYLITDINGGSPIASVNIQVNGNETQPINQSLTDASGLAILDINETLTYYNVIYSKTGYFSRIINYTTETAINEVLTPISEDGITRVIFHDKMSERRFCVFFRSNNRLKECYQQNDTVQLLVNQEYIIIPQTDTMDLISSPENIRANMGIYAGTITIIIITIMLLYGIYRMFKRWTK